MATIINEGGDSGSSALVAVIVIIAAIAVALFAFGAFNTAPPQHSDINVTVPAPSPPDSAPTAPTH